MGWLLIAATIVGTVYGQLVLKWQVNKAGDLPDGTSARVDHVVSLLLNPWVITVWLAAAVAALAWMGALTKFDLSRAYPFIGLTFVATVLGSVVLFGENLTAPKLIGTLVIVAGIVIASQG